LINSGVSAGGYASPHVRRINERISIAGELISDETLSRRIMRAPDGHEAARLQDTPAAQATCVDLFTAAAFVAFSKTQLALVVVEVGLGGLIDSTMWSSEVAVLTNIEQELPEVLGTTRSAIAHEKQGILEHGKHLVTTLSATDEAGRVLHERAGALACRVQRVGIQAGERIEERNEQMAGAVLNFLGQRESDAPDARCFRAARIDRNVSIPARLPGRMERLRVQGHDGKAARRIGWRSRAVQT